jgi:hypothetical protein
VISMKAYKPLEALRWPDDDAKPAKTIEEVRRSHSPEFNAKLDERLAKARARRAAREAGNDLEKRGARRAFEALAALDTAPPRALHF